MLKRLAIAALVLAALGGALFWLVTAPDPLQAAALLAHQPDIENGERIFHAGGCASCHVTPTPTHRLYKVSAAHCFDGQDRAGALAGGLALNTPFGVFCVPNITPDRETGIGAWSTIDFVNAVKRGIAPNGAHYYPAFPYSSYTRMSVEDLIDLKAYLDSLPPVAHQVAGHNLPFPFNIRRGLGLWKRLNLSSEPVVALGSADDLVKRGQYLVEGPGHCAECHTPRNFMGGLKKDQWLAGACDPEDPTCQSVIPNITPHQSGLADWSAKDIAYALESGFTPDYDTLGGSMAAIQSHMALLPADDRQAIAAYLKAIPPLPRAVQPQAQPQQ